MVATFKKQPTIYKLLTAGILVYAVYFVVKITYNMILGLDFPNELLEPSNIQLTQSILDGKIPYAREALVELGQRPGVSYEYPFITCLFAAGFSLLLGRNVILAHYIVSLLSIIGTGIVGALIVRRYSKTTVGPMFTFMLLMFCHWRYGYISAAPDDVGLFFSILTLFLVTNEKVKNKPIWGALGITVCFFTKQYFASIAISLFVFMCLYCFKDALKLVAYTFVFLLISGTLVTIFWPLYWDYSVLLLIVYACRPNGSLSRILYVFQQFGYLAIIFAGLLAILVIAFVKRIRDRKKNEKLSEKTIKGIQVKENNALALFVIQIPVQMLCLCVLGTNDGAFLTYFLQLWVPSVVIAAVICLEQMITDSYHNDENKKNVDCVDENLKPAAGKIQGRQLVFQIIYSVIVVVTIWFGKGKLPIHVLNESDIAEWNQAYSIIDEYREKGQVVYAKTLAYKGKECGDDIYLTDHDGDISERTYDVWKKTPWQQELFPNADEIFEENLVYREQFREKARNHELSLITHVGDRDSIFTDEFLDEIGYRLLTTISLQTGNTDYDTEFWVCE